MLIVSSVKMSRRAESNGSHDTATDITSHSNAATSVGLISGNKRAASWTMHRAASTTKSSE